MSALFGWNLLFSSVKDQIKNKADVIVCFAHYALISRNFSCIGVGDDKVLDGNETKSEQLPPDWNVGYALRYVYEGKLYHLKGSVIEDILQLNLIKVAERGIALICIELNSVKKLEGNIEDILPNYAELLKSIEADLIEVAVHSDNSKNQQTQTDATQQTCSPSAMDFTGTSGIRVSELIPRNIRRLVEVGQADLDPFFYGQNPLRGPSFGVGPGGGGMLFPEPGNPNASLPNDPLMRGLPRRGLPPGARFDPFHPPDADMDPNQRRMPPMGNRGFGNDFPPPGFGDNMFM